MRSFEILREEWQRSCRFERREPRPFFGGQAVSGERPSGFAPRPYGRFAFVGRMPSCRLEAAGACLLSAPLRGPSGDLQRVHGFLLGGGLVELPGLGSRPGPVRFVPDSLRREWRTKVLPSFLAAKKPRFERRAGFGGRHRGLPPTSRPECLFGSPVQEQGCGARFLLTVETGLRIGCGGGWRPSRSLLPGSGARGEKATEGRWKSENVFCPRRCRSGATGRIGSDTTAKTATSPSPTEVRTAHLVTKPPGQALRFFPRGSSGTA